MTFGYCYTIDSLSDVCCAGEAWCLHLRRWYMPGCRKHWWPPQHFLLCLLSDMRTCQHLPTHLSLLQEVRSLPVQTWLTTIKTVHVLPFRGKSSVVINTCNFSFIFIYLWILHIYKIIYQHLPTHLSILMPGGQITSCTDSVDIHRPIKTVILPFRGKSNVVINTCNFIIFIYLWILQIYKIINTYMFFIHIYS